MGAPTHDQPGRPGPYTCVIAGSNTSSAYAWATHVAIHTGRTRRDIWGRKRGARASALLVEAFNGLRARKGATLILVPPGFARHFREDLNPHDGGGTDQTCVRQRIAFRLRNARKPPHRLLHPQN